MFSSIYSKYSFLFVVIKNIMNESRRYFMSLNIIARKDYRKKENVTILFFVPFIQKTYHNRSKRFYCIKKQYKYLILIIAKIIGVMKLNKISIILLKVI